MPFSIFEKRFPFPKLAILPLLLLLSCANGQGGSAKLQVQSETEAEREAPPIAVGAERLEDYLPLLAGRRVGVLCNHTSRVGSTHLVDTLLVRRVEVVRLFTPEHGLRGNADAGEVVRSGVDSVTGLPVVSLYGRSKKPTPQQLKGIDVMLFDLQDVGVRCYTYLSTLHYMMEACAELGLPLVVLDRPNPNGHMLDGPVLQPKYRSFVGMHPIPWAHGMTLGELARMINGEGWLENGLKCSLRVVPCQNYWHSRPYALPVPPSPNLPTQKSVLLYPTLAFLEGTTLSVGRGTDMPFEIAGGPFLERCDFQFTPEPKPGAKNPPHKGVRCYGFDIRELPDTVIRAESGIMLFLLQRLLEAQQEGKPFFIPFFDRLAGTPRLRQQLLAGASPDEIRKEWQPELEAFKILREKYLLYP